MYSRKSAHLLGFLGLSSLSQGLLLEPATIQQNLLPSYDYVIVGAGPAGLVLANRLTEDAGINVLVLEAGPMDSREAGIMFPSNIGAEVGSRYDWNLTTVAQTSLDGTARSLSQGHAVAGGTILNGMIWTRGTQADYDAWKTLGNDGWGWDDMVPYFQKVEAFTNTLATSDGHTVTLSPDSSIYGQSGPVQISYSEYFYSQFNNFIEGNMELGLDLANDTSGGTNVGVTIPPSSMSATNQSRCDARAAYLDSAIDRTNLHIAPEQRVTQLILDQGDGTSDPIAEGVQFVSATDSSQVLSINATREVILAAGAIWTPTLLQVSGIGPSAVLGDLGIETIVDLPGVGNNLQDHGMVDPSYAYSSSNILTSSEIIGATLQAAEEDYYNNRTGPLTATLIEAIAYLPLSSLSSSYESLISNLSSTDPNAYLPSDYPAELRTGYAAQYQALIASLSSSTEGAIEIMSNSVGTIQVASQRPFSRGTVRPTSTSILDGVEVDPRYCSNPFDKDIVVMGLEWNSQLIQTSVMQELSPNPAASLTSGDQSQLTTFVNGGLGTEFHPCGTTAMMPLESGGVVNTNLQVYGVQKLRSVNSGVIPLIPSAHLQAVVYALAEKAAEIIIAAQSNTSSTATSSTSATRAAVSTTLSVASPTSTIADAMTTEIATATSQASISTTLAGTTTANALAASSEANIPSATSEVAAAYATSEASTATATSEVTAADARPATSAAASPATTADDAAVNVASTTTTAKSAAGTGLVSVDLTGNNVGLTINLGTGEKLGGSGSNSGSGEDTKDNAGDSVSSVITGSSRVTLTSTALSSTGSHKSKCRSRRSGA